MNFVGLLLFVGFVGTMGALSTAGHMDWLDADFLVNMAIVCVPLAIVGNIAVGKWMKAQPKAKADN